MSFCVVYKWKHEEVINHKARKFQCLKGELGMGKKLRWKKSDPEACFVNNSLSLNDKIIASKRAKWIKRGRKRKTTSIWTRRTWFFIWFRFHIFFILFHGFEYLCNESEYRKALFFCSCRFFFFLSRCRSQVVDDDFYFVVAKIWKSLYTELSFH